MKTLVSLATYLLLSISSPTTQSPNLLNNPMDVVFDSLHHRYIVSNYADGKIIGIDEQNRQSLILETDGHCKSLDLVGDTLFVAVDSRLTGYLMSSRKTILDIKLPTVYGTAGVAADSRGHVYVTAPEGKLFKVSVADSSYELLSDEGLDLHLHNCAFDLSRNQLIAVEHRPEASIKAINTDDGTVTELIRTEIGDFEGVAVDDCGNIYVASYRHDGSVLRYSRKTTDKPVLLLSGQATPSGLEYNRKDRVLALCLYEANQVVFLPDSLNCNGDSP